MSIASAGALEQPLDDETELVRRAKAHDSGTWAAWHDQYYPLIYRYAYSRLTRHEDAEDVASQVFLEAMKSIGSYRSMGRPILAWFYGIAHNVVSKKRREAARAIIVSDVEEVSSEPAPDGEEALLGSLRLKAALERLKPEHREILILRFLLDLPTREVAAILGKREGALYSLQVRAVSALRRQMAE